MLILLSAYSHGQEDPFQVVRSQLDTHSHIEDIGVDDQAGIFIETHLEKYSGDKYILIYERREYSDKTDHEPTTSQMITYTFSLEDLNPKSLNTLALRTPSGTAAYWMVEIHIRKTSAYIPYKNYTDIWDKGKILQRSTSEGKSRKITLGYFGTQEKAVEFTRIFKTWMDSSTHPIQ